MAGRLDDPGRTGHRGSQKIGEERAHRLPLRWLGNCGFQEQVTVALDRELATLLVEARPKLSELFIPHQHEEAGLRQPRGTSGIKVCRCMREGKAPIVRETLAGGQHHPLQVLGTQSFHRVTADSNDAHRHSRNPCTSMM
jgi:hypothetical protein